MTSTHLSLSLHIVFSTKHRLPCIESTWRSKLHAYIGGAAKREGVVPKIVGGVEDHVHILLEIRATHRLADVMRGIKAASSAWVRRELGVREFGWQDGYGAFSVSPSHRSGVVKYIRNQESRHRRMSFQEEYLKMLMESEVRYDPRYLW